MIENKNAAMKSTSHYANNAIRIANGVPKGIRTPVTAVKGRCPGPLDDGDAGQKNSVESGGARRSRTADLLHAMQALYQLSYSPTQEARNVSETSPGVKNL